MPDKTKPYRIVMEWLKKVDGGFGVAPESVFVFFTTKTKHKNPHVSYHIAEAPSPAGLPFNRKFKLLVPPDVSNAFMELFDVTDSDKEDAAQSFINSTGTQGTQGTHQNPYTGEVALQ